MRIQRILGQSALVCMVGGLIATTNMTLTRAATIDLCKPADATPAVAPAIETRAMMVVNSLQTGDATAIQTYISPSQYIQHNPGATDGRDVLLGMLGALGKSGGAKVNIKRVLVSGNLVALHTEYNLGGQEMVGFDVFRFDNGLIVEHWDNLLAKAVPNASKHTQTDGSVSITDLDKTQSNCTKVVEFVTKSLITPDPKLDITQYINPKMYIQHNPMVADGLEGFGALMQQMAANKQVMSYSKIHFVVAQGNFVLTASEGAFGAADKPTPTAFYDLFRLENGLIVEHWDVIAEIPAKDQSKNTNGKF